MKIQFWGKTRKIWTQNLLRNFYVLLDAAPCCFFEVTLGQFSATSSKTLPLHSQFSLLYLPQALRGVTEC